MKPSRRKFLTVTGSAAIASVAGVGSASASIAPSEIPVPDNTSMMYPTMGTSADNPTATIYGNFKCPFTQEFVNGNLQDIIEEYVVTGKLNIRFRQLAYEPNEGVQTHSQPGTFISPSDPFIGAGSLAVWDVSPEDYWSYFFTMFSQLVSGTVTADDLSGRMEAAGVDNIDEIIARLESERYSDLVRKSTETSRDLDVNNTPRFEVAGVIENPRHEVENILNFVESNLSGAVSHVPKEDTEEKQTQEPSESENRDTDSESKTTITFDGGSAEGWAHYEFTISGEFVTNRSTSASIGEGDSISGSTAKGGVGPWKDSYTFTGEITDITLTQEIDVFRNGELVDLDKLGVEIESEETETLDTELKSKQDSTNTVKSEASEAGSISGRICTR
jgi:protein-disulfide isomerase